MAGFGYGWSKVYFDPVDECFFYESYSTGYIDDCSTRYHGTYPLSLDEVKRAVPSKWPPNPQGVQVLNDVLIRYFPGEPLVEDIKE